MAGIFILLLIIVIKFYFDNESQAPALRIYAA